MKNAKPPIVPVLEALGFEGLSDWGGWRSTKCVLHGDKHASARYNPDECRYHCFACGIEGDVYDLIMEAEKVDFPTAQQRVASITGGSVPEVRGVPGSRGRSRLLGVKGDSATRRKAIQARRGGRRV